MGETMVNLVVIILIFGLVKLITFSQNKTQFLKRGKKCTRQTIYLRDALLLAYLVSVFLPAWYSGEITVFGATFTTSLFLIPGILLLMYLIALVQYRVAPEDLE